MKIGYLCFGRDDYSYGLALCLRDLDAQGHTVFRATPKTAALADWLVFSCFWWAHSYCLAAFLCKAGIDKKQKVRPRLVVGGFTTFNPAPLLSLVDFVVVGDGEGSLSALLSGRPTDNVLSDDVSSAAWHNAETVPGFCHETNGIARIEIARGCKYRCSFCAVSHLKPYREVTAADVIQRLRQTTCRRVSLFAPEPTTHSEDDALTAECRRLGKVRVDSDVRVDRLHKRSDSVPRVGVEGLSERLRRSVRKPISDETIIGACKRAIRAGRRGIFLYIILDLPGEEQSDWDAFRSLLNRVAALDPRFMLKPSPSVFLPTPFTPMEMSPINWQRNYADTWVEFFGRKEKRDWDCLMVERTRIFSPTSRVLSMIATRAGPEFGPLCQEMIRDGIVVVDDERVAVKKNEMFMRRLDQYGGPDYYCGRPTVRPWSCVKMAVKA